MSIQVLLSHYLAGLRERDELDAILPDLLREMGHSVLSRAQVGVDQGGVDVVSTAVNQEGVIEVFLFVIKFGDLGKLDFVGGSQSIDPSVRRAASEFISNRLPENCAAMRKRIVLLTNGSIKQEAQAAFSALQEQVGKYYRCEVEFWGIDQITPLIEQHLFDERLLLEQGQSDLRAAIGSIEQSEPSIMRFARFINVCIGAPENEQNLAKPVRKKLFLKRLTSVSMGWAVLLVWGRSEGNLKPGVVGGELLVLQLWAEAVRQGFHTDKSFLDRMKSLMSTLAGELRRYFEKILPALYLERELTRYRSHPVLYNTMILDELGRLATLILLLQRMRDTEQLRTGCTLILKKLVETHSGCKLPVLDGHAIDLSIVLLALMGEREDVFAKGVIFNSLERLAAAARLNRFLPVDSDILEDAIDLHDNRMGSSREFFRTSTLVPMLATFAAFLEFQPGIDYLNQNLAPLLDGVNLERWFPSVEMETMSSTGAAVTEVGASRSLDRIAPSAIEEATMSVKHISGVAKPSDFSWHGTDFEVLVAISARVHRHPVPTWYVGTYKKG